MKLAIAGDRMDGETNEKKTEHVQLYLPPAMKVSLTFLAKRDRRKLSDYVRLVLEKHITQCAAELDGEQDND